MRVRRASESDASAIAKVHVASWQGAYRGIIPDSFLSSRDIERRARVWSEILGEPNIHTFVALDDAGTVVGFSSIQGSRDDDASRETGEITSIYVTPEMWGRGHGCDLMGASLGIARDRGFSCLTLWVLEANQRARRFYEVAGFTPDGAKKTENRQGGLDLREIRYRQHLDLDVKADGRARSGA